MCCGMVEDNEHVLRECAWSWDVWKNVFKDCDQPYTAMMFREWFGSMMENQKHEVFKLFGVIAWQIWSARNDLIFEKNFISSKLCFKKANDMFLDYRKATLQDNSQGKTSRANVRWSPPALDTIKINVDATVNKTDDRVGLGVVARNISGDVILAASRTIWSLISVERAELEAFRWAVDLAKHHRWNKISIEGDAQIIVHALQHKLSRGFHDQVVVDNILEAAKDIHSISFSFCFREANKVAHRLAKWASSCICSNVWVDGGPLWILDIVTYDLIF